MEKKTWSLPLINFVEIASSDYCVSSCSSRTIQFECNAGMSQYGNSGTPPYQKYGWLGRLFIETGYVSGLQTTGDYDYKDRDVGDFAGCNTVHEITTTDLNSKPEELGIFYKGYYIPAHDRNHDNKEDVDSTSGQWIYDTSSPISVWIWQSTDGYHATERPINDWIIESSKS